ncbi:hypothetical protein [Chryseobacterium shigense]|uniref:Uncharacterized protein n=1 Tax=Chryseobacterium shigense TaxID=297244 RepID=A0A841MYN0_9FLAO|nr:hypothetical protein [Chryseobacterium shigense]MBB6369654.1 hypothetical protein [Chryseobacterium shigense]
MKNILRLFVLTVVCSCNMDNYAKLPFGGYGVDFEGGKNNRMMKNNMMIIDSGLVDCKYNDVYMLVSVDTTYSMNPHKVNKKNLKYFIQDLKKDTIIKKISYSDLQKIIKQKSLEEIDITK